MTKPIIYLAAGGTGGHLFPAIALSRALQKKNLPLWNLNLSSSVRLRELMP